MVLSDLKILERLVTRDEARRVFISPLVNPRVQLGPSSLDLHVGPRLLVARSFKSTHIDLNDTKEGLRKAISSYFVTQDVGAEGWFVLHPGEFALAASLEYFRLPLDLAGRLEGRSTIGRLGFQVHATAGFVDPGFEGTLTFELINSGRLPIKFVPGTRLGQICFFEVADVQVGYLEKSNQKYGRMLDVGLSRADAEPEIEDVTDESEGRETGPQQRKA
jgi:dCTP deaminase